MKNSLFEKQFNKMLDEKLTSRVFRLYSHKLHKQRLNDIRSKISTRINNSVPRTLKYQNIKRTGYVSQVRERKTNINRENEKIFQVITKISEGKRASSIYSVIDSSRPSPKPKSLNLTTRKKEAQRIIEDNYALAKRLSESTRGVSFKKFDDDWQNTAKYMSSISKRNIRKLPKLDELGKYLPTVLSSDVSSKKGISLKTPAAETHKNNFSPNLTSPLPTSVMDIVKEDKELPRKSIKFLRDDLNVPKPLDAKQEKDSEPPENPAILKNDAPVLENKGSTDNNSKITGSKKNLHDDSAINKINNIEEENKEVKVEPKDLNISETSNKEEIIDKKEQEEIKNSEDQVLSHKELPAPIKIDPSESSLHEGKESLEENT